jgi:hypothetical protein
MYFLELDLCFGTWEVQNYVVLPNRKTAARRLIYNIERIQFVASANTYYTFQSISVYCYKENKTMPPNSISPASRKPGRNQGFRSGFRQVRANLRQVCQQLTTFRVENLVADLLRIHPNMS